MISGKTILIAPLDWGHGHATRSVSIIRELEKNNRVYIGVTAVTRDVLNEEFPNLTKVEVPSYNIKYSKHLPLWLKLLLQWPRILATIRKEQKLLQKLVNELGINLVISDNRFGFYSTNVHSVFITHQLFLKAPVFGAIAQYINHRFILKFNEVWVPDYEDEKTSLSGSLGHGKHFHPLVKYIGPKSRLTSYKTEVEIKYDYLILLSGPEPQHSMLARQLVAEARRLEQKKFAFCSQVFNAEPLTNMEVFYKPNSNQLAKIILQSKIIICRSGYSTLMDLHLLGKKDFILIPTPGQTEQEYLAEYWKRKFQTRTNSQKNFQPTE